MSAAADEFYVGYRERAPAALGRRLRVGVATTLVGLAGLAWSLTAAHARRPPAAFEFGAPVALSGTLVRDPYPRLLVDRPGGAGLSGYTLVGPFKHGADDLIEGLEDRFVSLRATLAYRDGQVVAEVVPGSVRETGRAPAPPEPERSLGVHTLAGEIVDSKCFLGVMNPGETKPHRGCAVRCISGGIPPVLCVRDPEGRASYFLLVSGAGEALGEELLDLVAEPVEVTGEVRRTGDILVLRADADSYRRRE